MVSIESRGKKSTKNSTLTRGSSNDAKPQSVTSLKFPGEGSRSSSSSPIKFKPQILCGDYLDVVHSHLKRTEIKNKLRK